MFMEKSTTTRDLYLLKMRKTILHKKPNVAVKSAKGPCAKAKPFSSDLLLIAVTFCTEIFVIKYEAHLSCTFIHNK